MAAPKYGERTTESIDEVEVDLRRAQVTSIEKQSDVTASKNSLIVVVILVILATAVPVNVLLWHLATR